MAIYAGVGGVVRELDSVDVGRSSVVRHAYTWKAGVGGVVRTIKDITDQIDYVVAVADDIFVDTIDSDGNSTNNEGYDLETANKYGSITVTDSYIQTKTTTAKKQIRVDYTVYVVFKDGHRERLYEIINNSAGENSFSLSVTAYISFNDDGFYYTNCLGTTLKTDYVSGSESKTVAVTVATSYYGIIQGAMRDSGTCISRQTFNSITINGKSFSIKAISELS